MEQIRHRGDASRFGECWSAAGVSLGGNRLAIVDPEHGQQPLSDTAGRVRVVFNGEIYNFLALRGELEALGHKFRTESDTEVLVHGYLEWGSGLVDRLDGIFAFVLFDTARSTFLAARDHVGVKPLYHGVRDGVHYFASELKCLIPYVPEASQFPPGTYLTPKGEVRYFTLTHRPSEMTERDAVATYRRLLDAAVRKQVRTDLPLAVMFSGGVDSSAILHTALKYHPDVTAFTVGVEGAPDVVMAQRFCQERGIRHFVAYLDERELIAAIPTIVRGAEFFESIDVMETLVSYFLFRLVRQHGFRVAITGEGSDEVNAGYDLFKTHEDPLDLMRYRVHNMHRSDLQRVDRASMLHTVEARVPYLDRELLEFAYSLPMSLKIRGGVEKWILREAFRDELPEYLAFRPKARMPEGSGLRSTLVQYARQSVEHDAAMVESLGIDSPEGIYFLKQYLDAGFPAPRERCKRAGFDYSKSGYFIK